MPPADAPLTVAEVAARYRWSERTIRRIAQENGIAIDGRGRTARVDGRKKAKGKGHG